MFIETQLDKDGRACALEALEQGADVVIAVGGDGTVRTVASAMGGTNHAMGIIPIGTGNLFARNMNIPVGDLEAAMLIAISHGSYKVDIGRLQLLDHPEEDHAHAFLIIAGIGFDAVMIDGHRPQAQEEHQLARLLRGRCQASVRPQIPCERGAHRRERRPACARGCRVPHVHERQLRRDSGVLAHARRPRSTTVCSISR